MEGKTSENPHITLKDSVELADFGSNLNSRRDWSFGVFWDPIYIPGFEEAAYPCNLDNKSAVYCVADPRPISLDFWLTVHISLLQGLPFGSGPKSNFSCMLAYWGSHRVQLYKSCSSNACMWFNMRSTLWKMQYGSKLWLISCKSLSNANTSPFRHWRGIFESRGHVHRLVVSKISFLKGLLDGLGSTCLIADPSSKDICRSIVVTAGI